MTDHAADSHQVQASSALIETGRRVLKAGDSFAILNQFGDIHGTDLGEQGLFHAGTRYLSHLVMRVAGERLLLLSSSISQDNLLLTVDLMNPDLVVGASGERSGQRLPHGALHLRRAIFLREGAWYEHLRITSYGSEAVELPLSIRVGADYADIFEVRGERRARRGSYLNAEIEGDRIVLGYRGLDDRRRQSVIQLTPAPDRIDETGAELRLRIGPRDTRDVYLTISCIYGDAPKAAVLPYERAYADAQQKLSQLAANDCRIRSSNALFNAWVERSLSDLRMMTAETADGIVPHAGVPWFGTPFGRDGILTALQALWVSPTLARGALQYLAALQATELDPGSEAEPGKILHETRQGEMAALKEIPFGRYYGSVDATPLFVLLAAEYHRVTGDLPFVQRLLPAVERALAWIQQYGDADGDGFVEYRRKAADGLLQQGWKDSHDSVFHADGMMAEGPIALCEVQGYVYAAKRGAADLYQAVGQDAQASALRAEAEALRAAFDAAFWCEDLGTYALALDGHKRPCRVRTSNAGHCLFTGIALPERAPRLAAHLLSPEMFSGWGVRTLSTEERRYNPMSYHNGSVWPHDNALIGEGLASYGLKDEALQLLSGLFEVSLFVDLHRLPELLCGFAKRAGEGPTLYPVACAPQAWSAAAVLLLLKAAIGLSVDAPQARLAFAQPVLPESIAWLQLENLAVGQHTLDIELARHARDVTINVARRSGPVTVISVK